jgi:hypothetical protein
VLSRVYVGCRKYGSSASRQARGWGRATFGWVSAVTDDCPADCDLKSFAQDMFLRAYSQPLDDVMALIIRGWQRTSNLRA